MILTHHHPAGTTTPSAADRELARKIQQAAALMDIKVLDHLVFTMEGFYSFADEGL